LLPSIPQEAVKMILGVAEVILFAHSAGANPPNTTV
jgi:hypothetical protein